MFRILTQVSWMQDQIQKLELIGMNEIFNSYPVIRKKFFDDLVHNMENNKHYWAEKGLKSIILSEKEYEPHEWIFIAATDFRDRPFQILFSRSYEMGGSGAIAAVAPPEFAQFIQMQGKDGIIATLTLINDPKKMKSVAVIISAPEEVKAMDQIQASELELQRFKNWVDQMKASKNVEGQWFPTNEPICPNCNEKMLGLADIRVGFVKMLCPRCGKEINHSYK